MTGIRDFPIADARPPRFRLAQINVRPCLWCCSENTFFAPPLGYRPREGCSRQLLAARGRMREREGGERERILVAFLVPREFYYFTHVDIGRPTPMSYFLFFSLSLAGGRDNICWRRTYALQPSHIRWWCGVRVSLGRLLWFRCVCPPPTRGELLELAASRYCLCTVGVLWERLYFFFLGFLGLAGFLCCPYPASSSSTLNTYPKICCVRSVPTVRFFIMWRTHVGVHTVEHPRGCRLRPRHVVQHAAMDSFSSFPPSSPCSSDTCGVR